MTVKFTSLMLGLGLVAAHCGVAAAADWNNGGESYRRYGGGAAVPVPAPAPIPGSVADWYVRGDLNFSAVSSGKTSYSGPHIDLKSPDDMPRYFGAGFAVGRYITPSIRADLSIDYRSKQRLATGATVNHRDVTRVDATTGDTTVQHWTDTYSNEARIGNYAAMLNAYYDLGSYRGFTPYIGAGAGVAMHTLTRAASDHHVCDTMDTFPAAGPPNVIGANCPSSLAGYSSDAKSTTAYGFAGALMVGASYEVSPGVLWDSGYRMMYYSGQVAQTVNTGLGASMINIGDRIDHEFRTGMRWNID